jgi:acyl-CoA reductase-like NAD-dependent aldehyde dehydrogenase
VPEHLVSIRPTTGDEIDRYERHESDAVEAAIRLADAQHRSWRESSFDARASVLRNVADVLESQADDLASLMADEMGKPVTAGCAEPDVVESAVVCMASAAAER